MYVCNCQQTLEGHYWSGHIQNNYRSYRRTKCWPFISCQTFVLKVKKLILYDSWQDPTVSGSGNASKYFCKTKLPQKLQIIIVWWLGNRISNCNFLVKTSQQRKHCQKINNIHLCPTMVNWKGPLFLHDNAWPHILQMTLLCWN